MSSTKLTELIQFGFILKHIRMIQICFYLRNDVMDFNRAFKPMEFLFIFIFNRLTKSHASAASLEPLNLLISL